MSLYHCEHCDKPARKLTAVQTLAASFWSPAEYQLFCDACIQREQDRAEADEARRDEIAERRGEERAGR